MKTRLLVLGLVSLFLGACATTRGERREAAQALLEARPPAQILETPFIAQPKNQCGPASLTMALRRQDPRLSLDEVSELTYTPGAHGSFQTDMLAATRRLGFAPYAVRDFKAMLTAIGTGEPVLVFQNLGFKAVPVWHYALLVGYDAPKEELVLHTGDTPYERIKLAAFLKTWDRGDRWSYVVSRPGILPDFATLDEALENAEVFSRLGLRPAAFATYRAAQNRWPGRYEADAGLALEYAAEGRTGPAIGAMKTAIEKNPESPGLYFNLAYLYRLNSEERAFEEAKRMSLQKAPAEEREDLLRRYAEF